MALISGRPLVLVPSEQRPQLLLLDANGVDPKMISEGATPFVGFLGSLGRVVNSALRLLNFLERDLPGP